MVMMTVSGLVDEVTVQQFARSGDDQDLATVVRIAVENPGSIDTLSIHLPDQTVAWLYAAEQFEGAAKELRRLVKGAMGAATINPDRVRATIERDRNLLDRLGDA